MSDCMLWTSCVCVCFYGAQVGVNLSFVLVFPPTSDGPELCGTESHMLSLTQAPRWETGARWKLDAWLSRFSESPSLPQPCVLTMAFVSCFSSSVRVCSWRWSWARLWGLLLSGGGSATCLSKLATVESKACHHLKMLLFHLQFRLTCCVFRDEEALVAFPGKSSC